MALDNLRIIKFQAENVKRIKAVEITPSGEVVEVMGKNGHGKTSILDSIKWAIQGKKEIQWMPIREGQETALIRLDLGNDEGFQLRITRTFRLLDDGEYTTDLHLTTPDGMKLRGEQTLLSTLVGAIAFDPGAFMHAQPHEQAKMLKSVVPDFDFEENARKRDKVFKERTDINREEKRFRASAEAIVVDEGTPDEPVPTDAILEKIRDAGRISSEYHAALTKRDEKRRQVTLQDGLINDCIGEIERLEERLAEWRADLTHYREKRELLEREANNFDMPSPPEDTAELSAELARLQEINKRVEVKKSQLDYVKAANEHKATSESLTKQLADLDRDAARAIELADLPVRGLEIRDDAVYLRGVPFNQASDAEQLRASMALGMAANPKIRVLRIRDGSLLDEDAMQIIREVAADEQFQIWIERVGTNGGPEAVIIENGEIRHEET